jgi:class 3 adenylate cyclase/CHASE2 domain-containing sensor protein
MSVVKRDLVAVLLVAVLSALATTLPPVNHLHGWSIDILTALRWRLFDVRRDVAPAPVAVIAIDEETYGTVPFKGSPTPTWTTEIGRVLTAVLDGGASVAGFDIVFANSIEQSEIPFGDDFLGAKLRGFDRPFLLSLRAGADAGKLLLGEVLRPNGSVGPSPGQRIAVHQRENIRPLNIITDRDDIVRRVQLTFAGKEKPIPSMALELAARAQQAEPVIGDDGSVTLAGYRVPSTVPNTMTLNFDGGARDIRTYSLADLRACVERGDKEFFRREFAGKVVIFGTLTDEDRKFTSKRFATGSDRANGARCTLPPAPPSSSRFARSTIAGVYIHAAAVNNLLTRDALVELGPWSVRSIALGFALLAAFASRWLTPAWAASAGIGVAAIWTVLATLMFRTALVLPLSEPLTAAILAGVMITAYRLVVTDRGQRLLRRSFALYLAPQVIDRMLVSNRLPALGGETREVTIFFSDLAGFSAISEQMTPTELVVFMNEYLSEMTDIIEAEGGYVEKYIGDSIVAVFGAPVDDADHARHAVTAALNCRSKLEELNRDSPAFHGIQVAHRMGLNSGEALVGNIGSRRRFNYSVMSDAVNVASRLEGANKYYGTTIIASETTVAATGRAFAWRELDAVRVKGRTTPVKIYELVAETGQETPQQQLAATAYAQGLAHWRAREFDAAVSTFSRAAEFDKASALFVKRSEELAKSPPGADWEPVNALDSK